MNAAFNYYNTTEVAEKAGVTPVTICNWVRKGRIHCKDVGEGPLVGRYQFSEENLAEVLDFKKNHSHGKGLGTKSCPDQKGKPKRVKLVTAEKPIKKEGPTVAELLDENRRLRLEIEKIRKEKDVFMSSMLELMAQYE